MIVAKYKFNPSTYADYLPMFNTGYTSYTKSDTTNSDGTITRTIESSSLPTQMRFGETNSVTDRSKSLLEVLDMNTSNLTSMYVMFRFCTNLTSITCSWNTSQVIDVAAMFASCSSLTSLDVSNWDVSQVTTMFSTFYDCSSLTSLDVSNWNTSKVTNMSATFQNCSSLTQLNVSNWDTSKVTTMNYMFYKCSSLISLDLSKWNTSKVTNIQSIFQGCSSLTSLDISNWNTSHITDMSTIVSGCSSLTSLDLSNWNTSKVTSMVYLVYLCSNLTTLDISNWDMSQVTNTRSMFSGASSLYKINLKYANESTVSKIHTELLDRSSTTKGYILSSVDLTSDKNWQIIKSSHNNFYLPQPLRKIGDIKDRFYWDENKGHYCIEQNTVSVIANETNVVDSLFKLDGYYTFAIKVDNVNTGNLIGINSYGIILVPYSNLTVLNKEYISFGKEPSLEQMCAIVRIKNSKVSNKTELLEYFKSNRFTLVYKMSTPNIIDLPHLNQKLIFDSYTPSTTIDIPNSPLKASKTYLDAPIARYRYTNLQPSTQYNVQFDCKGDVAIKVNLGGTEVTFTPTSDWTRKNLTITTPSELVNDKLSISNVGITSNNKIDNVMLFSEVIAQEPDYIDGIQSIGELQSNGTYKIDILTRNNFTPLFFNGVNYGMTTSDNASITFGENIQITSRGGNTLYTPEITLKPNQYLMARIISANGGSTYTCGIRTPSGGYVPSELGTQTNAQAIADKVNANGYFDFGGTVSTETTGRFYFSFNFGAFTISEIYICEGLDYSAKISKHSIYLPQPLRKKGNAKDKFYWDDDMGYYCIEQNISDNLEVLSASNIIDLPEMNQKFSFDTYLPNTYVDVTNLPLQPYKLQLEDDTVRYKSTLEPSTLYTIQFNCVSKLTTRLTLDLGGTRKTVDPIIGVNHVQITTPSVLASDRLFLIGTGIVVKEVIVNKGNMRQYPAYFDGEQSVGELQTDGSYKIVIKTNEGFTVTICTDRPLTKLDKIYWNNTEKRYEIDRNGVIEVPTVEGNIVDLPRLYQKVDTTINISTDNIEPSKIDISYKDINNN